jgi:hypothetical protein
LNGEVHKYFRKEWNKNANGIMDLVMEEFPEKEKLATMAQKAAAEAEEDQVE